MSSRATQGSADSGRNVIRQLAARPTHNRGKAVEATALKANDNHVSTTIIERISQARRGYLAWLALRTETIIGKEPTIDSEADASWRAR